METSIDKWEHCTPSEEELRPSQKIKCSEPDCTAIFNNLGNLEMHLEKHHKIPLLRKGEKPRLYYCPVANCIYRLDRVKGKFFKNLKYLKQHYQKVHMIRDFKCPDCSKSFISEPKLKLHQQQLCGKKFICLECKWSYDSMEALQTHGKRKGHITRIVDDVGKNIGKVPIKPLKLTKQNATTMNKQQQTKFEEHKVGKCEVGVQTDFLLDDGLTNTELTNALNDIQSVCSYSYLKDIETQTEPPLPNNNDINNGTIATTTTSTTTYLDQMLAQSSHMYTQTCEDFLNELGLADIQTQTNWPSPPRESNVEFTSTATSTNPCVHDELLVSTETQTSFTQYLMNSCTDVGTNPETSAVGAFSGLYHTQHTQTCDPDLLDSFHFDAHDNDFIDGFQSTYTQT